MKLNKTSKAQIKAAAKYDSANTLRISIKLNKKTDTDIISRLNQQTNKQGYIKKLIRADMQK